MNVLRQQFISFVNTPGEIWPKVDVKGGLD